MHKECSFSPLHVIAFYVSVEDAFIKPTSIASFRKLKTVTNMHTHACTVYSQQPFEVDRPEGVYVSFSLWLLFSLMVKTNENGTCLWRSPPDYKSQHSSAPMMPAGADKVSCSVTSDTPCFCLLLFLSPLIWS